MHEFDAVCAQRFQALNFGIDIVRLDIQMHAIRMINLLQQDHWFVGGGLQLRVFAVAIFVGIGDRLAQCATPEFDGRREIFKLAVDHDVAQSALMHGLTRLTERDLQAAAGVVKTM